MIEKKKVPNYSMWRRKEHFFIRRKIVELHQMHLFVEFPLFKNAVKIRRKKSAMENPNPKKFVCHVRFYSRKLKMILTQQKINLKRTSQPAKEDSNCVEITWANQKVSNYIDSEIKIIRMIVYILTVVHLILHVVWRPKKPFLIHVNFVYS